MRRFTLALRNQNSARILSFVFDRLYVLRNQLIARRLYLEQRSKSQPGA